MTSANEAEISWVSSHRILRSAAMHGVVYQAVYSVFQLLVLAVIVRIHGPQGLGLWTTAYATVGIMQLFILGQHGAIISNGAALARARPDHLGSVALTAACVVALPSVLLLLGLLGLSALIPWPRLLGAPVTATSTLRVLMPAVLGLAALTLPLSLGQSVLIAAQRSAMAYKIAYVSFAAGIVALAGVALIVRPGLPLIAALALLPSFVAGFVQWAYAIGCRLIPQPTRSQMSRTTVAASVRTGVQFLAVEITTVMLMRSPELILSHVQSLTEVARFAAVNRFPLLMFSLTTTALQPLWPAIREAAHNRDVDWITSASRKALFYCGSLWLTAIAGAVLFGPAVLTLWLGTSLFSSRPLLLCALALAVAQGFHYWITICLAGLEARRTLVVMGVAMCGIFLPLAPLIARHGRSEGVFVGLAAVYGLAAVGIGWPTLRLRLRQIARAKVALSGALP